MDALSSCGLHQAGEDAGEEHGGRWFKCNFTHPTEIIKTSFPFTF
jgi:hypothetical protein